MIQKLGRYELIRVLGKGAMGLVYEGRDPNLDRRVAIKTIRVENLSEEAAAEYQVRFRTEAHSAARLQHPNIVSVYDSDQDADIAYMVMEFIAGDDLKHHLDQGSLYTLEQTLGIMQDLLSALAYAHAQGVIHRDIKPANLLIEKSGRVKLTDFGVARIQDSGEATRTQGTMVGTLKYMSPEQVQGRAVDARADIFAAGIVLYQLLTGKRPFDGATDFAIIQQIVGHTPVSPTTYNTRLPPAMDVVVARALTKVRDDRYATAGQFMAALQAASRDAADPTVVPPGSPRLSGMPGTPGTGTSTTRAGEALVGTQAGLQSGSGVGQSTVTQEIELVYWKDIKDSMDAEDLQCFMAKFPSGIYADLARRRLRKLGIGGGDESSTASAMGTATLVLPDKAAVYEPTMRLSNGQTTGPTTSQTTGQTSRQTRDRTFILTGRAENYDEHAPTQFADESGSTLFHHHEDLSWSETQITTRLPADNGRADSAFQAVPPAARPPQVKPFVAEASVVPAGRGPGAVNARQTVRNPRPLQAMVFGLVLLLVAAGYGVSRLTPSWSPAAAGIDLAATATAGPANAALMLPPEPEAGRGAGSPSGVISVPALSHPVKLVAEPNGVAMPEPAAGKTPAELKSEAKAEAKVEAKAAIKKAALEKQKLARQTEATAAAEAAAAGHTDTPADHASKRPAVAPSTAAALAVAAPTGGSPRQACEDRMLLGFQICMAEQCAKRVFIAHPVCVERRLMDERRRETEQSRR